MDEKMHIDGVCCNCNASDSEHECRDCPALSESEPSRMFRTLITEACYPAKAGTGEEFAQATTVLIHRYLEMAVTLHALIGKEAPILLQRSPVGIMLANLGQVLWRMEQAGLDWMAEHSVEPLNLRAEEVRVAQHELDTVPADQMPEGIRDELERIVAEGQASDGEIDWAAIVMPGSGQVH